MKVFTPQQMRAFDRAASEQYGVPSIVLMENAALRVVEFLEAKFAPLRDKRIVILCGKGNNGGDGLAIARHLHNANTHVQIIFAAGANELMGDALTNYNIVHQLSSNSRLSVMDAVEDRSVHWSDLDCDFVIDALIGTGFSGQVRGEHLKAAIEFIQIQRNWKTPIIAVDIPSALNARSGEAAPEFVCADYTITFAAPKRGMFLRDGLTHCGEIWIGDIGTPQIHLQRAETDCFCTTRETARELLPQRSITAHKGDAGRVLVIGGSAGMSGAVALASRAALKVGAGLCTAAVPQEILSTFAASVLEATSHPLPCDERGRLIAEAADELGELWKNVQVVAIGPGISRSDGALELVRRVVRECPQPLVIDADALYALRAIADEVRARQSPTILTPHPGEMGELMEMTIAQVEEDRLAVSLSCARKYGAVVVLKGARSVVAVPDYPSCSSQSSGATFINLSGNAGMATGGSGDALTGAIAGLLAQLKDAQCATTLGVYLHGLAGDLCFATLGNGLIAGDIVDALPLALRDLERDDSAVDSINGRLRRLR